MSVHVLLNLLNEMGGWIKCEACNLPLSHVSMDAD